MKKVVLVVITTVLAFSLFVGCASSTSGDNEGDTTSKSQKTKKVKYDEKEFTKAYLQGDIASCIGMLENKNTQNPDIQYMLNQAMLEHWTEDWQSSQKTMDTTEIAIDEAFTKSITKAVGATLVNDNIAQYSGNIYEYLLINAFNVLNYYNQGNLEGAVVEIRKIDVKNKEYVNKYGEIALQEEEPPKQDDKDAGSFDAALKQVGLSMQDITGKAPQKPTIDNIYRDSAFYRYLGVVIRTIYSKQDDNNSIDAKFLAALNPSFSNILSEETNIPSGNGRLDILSLGGGGAYRLPSYTTIPIATLATLAPGLNGYQELAPALDLHYFFPIAKEEDKVIKPESVTVGDKTINLSLLEDFDKAVENDVVVKARKSYMRSVYRSTAKKASAVVAAATTMKEAKDKASKLPAALQEKALEQGVKVAKEGLLAIDETEAPDIRQCNFMPKAAYAGGINLAPGTYTVTVKYSNGFVDTMQNVKIEAGKTALVESVCLK